MSDLPQEEVAGLDSNGLPEQSQQSKEAERGLPNGS